MKIKVSRIRKIIADAIGQEQKEFNAALKKEQTNFEQYRKEWLKKYQHKWVDAIPKLQSAIREGVPITMDMLPVTGQKATRYDLAIFNEDPPDKEVFQPSCHYKTVLAILDLSDDDEIAISALGSSNVRDIIESAQAACKPRKR